MSCCHVGVIFRNLNVTWVRFISRCSFQIKVVKVHAGFEPAAFTKAWTGNLSFQTQSNAKQRLFALLGSSVGGAYAQEVTKAKESLRKENAFLLVDEASKKFGVRCSETTEDIYFQISEATIQQFKMQGYSGIAAVL